jgi:hypothetical protein
MLGSSRLAVNAHAGEPREASRERAKELLPRFCSATPIKDNDNRAQIKLRWEFCRGGRLVREKKATLRRSSEKCRATVEYGTLGRSS